MTTSRSATGVQRAGVIIGRPLALIIALIWAAQTVGFALLIRQNSTQKQTIHQQSEEIRRLKERLQILEIIEDYQTTIDHDDAVRLANRVVDCGHKYGFDPLLILGMIQVESSFGPRAVSHVGARGLMQMKPSTARAVAYENGWNWTGAESLFEPVYNVRLGTEYLFDLVLKFGSVEKAIIAYNHGETAVRGLMSRGMKLPQAYLRRVLKEYRRLQRRYDPSALPDFIGPRPQ
jgi:soluble lytic murein transglycosylase-like protein